MKKYLSAGLLLAAVVATPAQAGEVFGGIYVHGVDTPLTLGGSPEKGFDLQLGFRGGAIVPGTGISLYLFGARNSRGYTSYAAAGLSRKFGNRLYVRPGIGLAIHDGSTTRYDIPGNDRIEFGSRILFEPEIGFGARINDRLSAEASWVHMSHATLFSGQNPGIDNIGARLNLKL